LTGLIIESLVIEFWCKRQTYQKPSSYDRECQRGAAAPRWHSVCPFTQSEKDKAVYNRFSLSLSKTQSIL